MFKSKSTTPPTVEQRIASAAATREAALSVFHSAAADLDHAADEANLAAEYAEAEANRLLGVATDALRERDAAAKSASLIRSLLA